MSDTLARFGHRLRSLRAARGWSMTELGDRSGLSRSGLYHLERGSSNPSLDVLCRLAAGLNIDLLTLLDMEEPTEEAATEIARFRDALDVFGDALIRLRGAEPLRRQTARESDEERKFLLTRAQEAGHWSPDEKRRWTGRSSNALVRVVFTGGDIRESEYPRNPSDLAACERAVDRLPPHLAEHGRRILEDFRVYVQERCPAAEVAR